MASMFHRLMSKADQKNKDQTLGASAHRLKEIVEIVAKHEITEGLTPEKATAILEDLGPTFVKLGQIASTHPDILPQEYCDAFAQLRANVTPMTADVVHAQIEEELGAPMDELFSDFDDAALGSASIAQVHKATLKKENRVVAIKVQRPGIIDTVIEDLSLMKRLISLQSLVSHKEGQISLKELVDELERTSADELDFSIEANNLTRFYAHNHSRQGITSPNCYHDYCTNAILTEDFISGPRLGTIDTIEGLTEQDRESLGYLIANNYIQQILEDGFFHADPHAGNIIVDVENKGIKWIDFGMMGHLSASDREVLRNMMKAIAKQDAYSLEHNLLKMATPKGPIDHGVLLSQCEDLMGRYTGIDLADFDTSALFGDLMDILSGSGFDINPSLVMLGRGLITLEGTISHVSSKVNIMQAMTSYISQSFNPKEIQNTVRRLASQGIDSVEALTSLPTKTSEILDMLQKGDLKLHMDFGVEKRAQDFGKLLIHRLSLTLIGVAFLLGSSVLCLTDLKPIVLEVPLLALVGYVIAVVLIIVVLLDMRRDR